MPISAIWHPRASNIRNWAYKSDKPAALGTLSVLFSRTSPCVLNLACRRLGHIVRVKFYHQRECLQRQNAPPLLAWGVSDSAFLGLRRKHPPVLLHKPRLRALSPRQATAVGPPARSGGAELVAGHGVALGITLVCVVPARHQAVNGQPDDCHPDKDGAGNAGTVTCRRSDSASPSRLIWR